MPHYLRHNGNRVSSIDSGIASNIPCLENPVAGRTLRARARLPEHRPRHFRRGTHLLGGNQLNWTIAVLDAGPCIVYDL